MGPTDFGVSECDRDAAITRNLWRTGTSGALEPLAHWNLWRTGTSGALGAVVPLKIFTISRVLLVSKAVCNLYFTSKVHSIKQQINKPEDEI